MRFCYVAIQNTYQCKWGAVISQKNILVADDDPDIREITGHNLIKSGYQVVLASNGIDAIKSIKEVTFDLIISDLSMPDMDGFELMNELAKRKDKIPLIVISGLSEERCMLNMADKLGADYTFEKPFDNFDLINKVNELLSI